MTAMTDKQSSHFQEIYRDIYIADGNVDHWRWVTGGDKAIYVDYVETHVQPSFDDDKLFDTEYRVVGVTGEVLAMSKRRNVRYPYQCFTAYDVLSKVLDIADNYDTADDKWVDLKLPNGQRTNALQELYRLGDERLAVSNCGHAPEKSAVYCTFIIDDSDKKGIAIGAELSTIDGGVSHVMSMYYPKKLFGPNKTPAVATACADAIETVRNLNKTVIFRSDFLRLKSRYLDEPIRKNVGSDPQFKYEIMHNFSDSVYTLAADAIERKKSIITEVA
jgi:hypothetical protein